jgi:hypothetical protein
MAKNNQFLRAVQNAAFEGRKEGILFGLDLCAIALNHTEGFGRKRIDRVSDEVQTFLNEIRSIKDYDRIRTDLVKELTRIYGEETREFWINRYISVTSGI